MSLRQVAAAAAAISAAEWVAVALALAYLLLAVRQNIACWSFAALSSGIFLWLFGRAGLPMQSALQAFYIAMAAYGWYSWRGGLVATERARPVVRWPMSRHLAASAVIVIVSVVNARWSESASHPLVPYVDALVAWGSVYTTWLVARKVLENWFYWIVLDVAAAGLYWTQGLYATALLFILYAGIAVQGYRSWRSTMGPFAGTAAT